jgi:hypothetical protein
VEITHVFCSLELKAVISLPGFNSSKIQVRAGPRTTAGLLKRISRISNAGEKSNFERS